MTEALEKYFLALQEKNRFRRMNVMKHFETNLFEVLWKISFISMKQFLFPPLELSFINLPKNLFSYRTQEKMLWKLKCAFNLIPPRQHYLNSSHLKSSFDRSFDRISSWKIWVSFSFKWFPFLRKLSWDLFRGKFWTLIQGYNFFNIKISKLSKNFIKIDFRSTSKWLKYIFAPRWRKLF
jgi:hypothetical protein